MLVSNLLRILVLICFVDLSLAKIHCYNGGILIESTQTCRCTKNFKGPHCLVAKCINGFPILTDLVHQIFNRHNSTEHRELCKCSSGWEGQFCEFPICTHGKRQENGKKCICDDFHSGIRCEQPKCRNGGLSSMSGGCMCIGNFINKWTGEFCEIPVCKHGHLSARNRCICDKGYSGIHCEKPQCGMHGTVALDKCYCYSSWEGEFCHLPKCYHGHRKSNAKYCTCDKGYSGIFCNEAKCKHGTSFYGSCNCAFTSYTGELCDQIVCKYGTAIGTNKCKCHAGYKGTFCNKRKAKSPTKTSENGSHSGTWVIIIAVLFCISFCCCLLIAQCDSFYKKWRRSEQNQSSDNAISTVNRSVPMQPISGPFETTVPGATVMSTLENIDHDDQPPSYVEAMGNIFVHKQDSDKLPSYSEVFGDIEMRQHNS